MSHTDDWALIRATCEQLTSHLLAGTRASRTTVRLLDRQGDLLLVAESLAPGVPSMASGPSVDPRVHETYVYLVQTHQLLVQDDCRTASVRPPESLVEHYRVWAQMLAPVVVDGEFRGTISVHLMDQTRDWDEAAVAALQTTRQQLEATLEERRDSTAEPDDGGDVR